MVYLNSSASRESGTALLRSSRRAATSAAALREPGIRRAMFSGTNFDCLQFADRASSCMTIDGIYARRREELLR